MHARTEASHNHISFIHSLIRSFALAVQPALEDEAHADNNPAFFDSPVTELKCTPHPHLNFTPTAPSLTFIVAVPSA